MTLVRDTMPEGLFHAIESEGGWIEERYPGIYYITGVVGIPTQFVLTSRLNGENHSSLRLLSENAHEEDVINFFRAVRNLQNPGDRQNIDAVLTVSSSVNNEVFTRVKQRGENMSDVLRELMKDEIQAEIQEEKQKAVDHSLIDVIRNIMENQGWDADRAMKTMGISPSDQVRYAALLSS